MEVQCKTFTLRGDDVPTPEMSLEAGDPDQLAQMWQSAGLRRLARSAPKDKKANLAACRYVEMSANALRLYSHELPKRIDLEDCPLAPPTRVVALLIALQQQSPFEKLIAMTNKAEDEVFVVGAIGPDNSWHYFKVAQWGKADSVDDLTSFKSVRNEFIRQSVIYGGLTILCAAAAWLIAVCIILGLPVYGPLRLISYENTPWTETVIVCGAYQHNQVKDDNTDWVLVTSNGNMTLENGYYDGHYFGESKNDGPAAKMLIGKKVQVTVHGHHGKVGTISPFVSKATTLGTANCG